MSPEALQLAARGLALIEQTRYRMGVPQFLEAFIDHWAFLHTGMYPAKLEIPDDLKNVAMELSHVLSKAMKVDPTGDILGYILSMSGFHKKGTNYYSTPADIGQMLSRLLGYEDKAKFYEPCCGTGINAIQWMDRLIQDKGAEALKGACVYLEDIDVLMVKCSMLQLFHYFDARRTTPMSLSIVGIDTLSRQTKRVAYFAEAHDANKAEIMGQEYMDRTQIMTNAPGVLAETF